jgi:hypothetical protein
LRKAIWQFGGRQEKQPRGLYVAVVLRHAVALKVEDAEDVLRGSIALRGC